MIDLERDLRSALRERADNMPGSTEARMPPSVRRRARRRQAVTVTLGGLIVAILAVGGTVTASRIFPGPPTVRPVERPTQPVPTRPLPSPDEVTVVGSGVSLGHSWDLLVTHGVDGWCLGVRTEKGTGLGCDSGERRSALEVGATTGTGLPKFVSGAISERVSSIEASTAQGDRLTLRAFDVPPELDAPFDRVFITVVPKGTSVVVTAFDENGQVILSTRA